MTEAESSALILGRVAAASKRFIEAAERTDGSSRSSRAASTLLRSYISTSSNVCDSNGGAHERADGTSDSCAYGRTDKRAFEHTNGIADDVADGLSE